MPSLGAEDAASVHAVLDGPLLVDGPLKKRFETMLATDTGKAGAAAVTSGSAALHLALQVLDLPAGSRVAIPSYGCISLLQAVRRAGAEPLLVDCEPGGFQADPDDLRRRLTGNTAAVIVVHTFGMEGHLEEFAALGLPVIEDIATAVGGCFDGEPAGARGTLATCSFHATKMMTTGSGGAVLWKHRSHGEALQDLLRYDARDDGRVRYNESMNELSAALGLSQLGRLESFVQSRTRIAEIYRAALYPTLAGMPRGRDVDDPAWHRFVVRMPGSADSVREHLQSAAIASPRPIYRPLHQILKRSGYDGAEAAHQQALSLPIYPKLRNDDLQTVIREVLACSDHSI